MSDDGVIHNTQGVIVKHQKRTNAVNWRKWLRSQTQNGSEVHTILLGLARGVPRIVTLLDGREHVIVPTAEVQARVAIHLDEMLHGKAVTQTEQMKAEREASHVEAVRAMSDEELERQYLEAKKRKELTHGTEDAQLVVESFWKEVFDALDSGLDVE